MERVGKLRLTGSSLSFLLKDIWAHLADGKDFIAVFKVVKLRDIVVLDQTLCHRVLVKSFLCVQGKVLEIYVVKLSCVDKANVSWSFD